MCMWIDADYAVHSDTRSHNGGAKYTGHGVLHKKASEKRLNTKISTEAKLVGMNEYLTYNLWLVFFLHIKGYGIMNNIVYLDNQISIRTEKIGGDYCTGN